MTEEEFFKILFTEAAKQEFEELEAMDINVPSNPFFEKKYCSEHSPVSSENTFSKE